MSLTEISAIYDSQPIQFGNKTRKVHGSKCAKKNAGDGV